MIGSSLTPGLVLLGTTFIENYLVIYDFENTTIGINGWVLQDQPIEPHKEKASEPMSAALIAIILSGVVAILLIGGGLVFIFIRRRNLKQDLSMYEQLEDNMGS